MTSDPSSNLMNYVKFTVVIAASLATKDLEKQKNITELKDFFFLTLGVRKIKIF